MPVPIEFLTDVKSALLGNAEPTVLLVSEPTVLLVSARLSFSRIKLLPTSQHRLEAVPLVELVPVPCPFAIPAAVMSTAPVITAGQILFIMCSLTLNSQNADDFSIRTFKPRSIKYRSGKRHPDDFTVIWREASHRQARRRRQRIGDDLDDCKRQFKAAWATLRAGLTDEDIARAHEMQRW